MQTWYMILGVGNLVLGFLRESLKLLVIIYPRSIGGSPMAYSLPVFNLQVSIWRSGNPTTNPPDLQTVGNLALGRRISGQHALASSGTADLGGMWLLLPRGTDIRDNSVAGGPDTVEVGSTTQRFYTVNWVDDAGSGFPNEHRFAELLRNAGWPVPIPTPTPPSPPLGSNLLIANSDTGVSVSAGWTQFVAAQNVVVILLSIPPGIGFTVTSALTGVLTPIVDTLPTPSGSTNDYLLLTCVYLCPTGFEVIDLVPSPSGTFSFCFVALTSNLATFDVFASNVQITSPMTTTLGGPTTGTNDIVLTAWGTVNALAVVIPQVPCANVLGARLTVTDVFGMDLDLAAGVYVAGPPGVYAAQAITTPGTGFAGVSYLWAFM